MEAHHTGAESELVGLGIGYSGVVGLDQTVADSVLAGADSDLAGADSGQVVVGTGCVGDGDTWGYLYTI